jgi:hypothetical protein
MTSTPYELVGKCQIFGKTEALKMETASSFGTLASTCDSTQRHNPENRQPYLSRKGKVVPLRPIAAYLGDRKHSIVVSITLRPRFTPGERAPGTHCTGGWVGPTAGLDAEVRGKILCLCRGSNPGRPVRSETIY